MKYYCKNCGSVISLTDDIWIPQRYCPICGYDEDQITEIPDYETPAQYEKRTGDVYPDEGLVWNKINPPGRWFGSNYKEAEERTEKGEFYDCNIIIIANPPVPPRDDFVPEGN